MNVLISDIRSQHFYKIFLAYISEEADFEGRRGRDRMVVGFTTTCAISAYHH